MGSLWQQWLQSWPRPFWLRDILPKRTAAEAWESSDSEDMGCFGPQRLVRQAILAQHLRRHRVFREDIPLTGHQPAHDLEGRGIATMTLYSARLTSERWPEEAPTILLSETHQT